MVSLNEVRVAFLDPVSTLSTVVQYRDIMLPMVANIVDEMVELGPDKCSDDLIFRVSVALLKALNLMPQVLEREVLLYFSVFPAPSHLYSCDDMNDGEIYECVESTLLGLYASNELCGLWEWYDMVPFIRFPDERVQWYGMKAMGLILGTSFAPIDVESRSIQDYEIIWKETLAKHSIYRNQFYSKNFVSHDIHSSGLDMVAPPSPRVESWYPHRDILKEALRSSNRYIFEEGFMVAKRDCDTSSTEYLNFYPTPGQRDILRRFAMALSINKNAILLDGPSSSGKTEVINYIASRTGNTGSLIRVHLDDQIDAKTLLGGYVCTENPGEFIWASGPVVRALKNGCWLVLENINLASSEVITMISSLARTGSVDIPSRGESVKARSGFQLIITYTSYPGRVHDQNLERMIFSCCVHMQLDEICLTDQCLILEQIYPSIAPLIPGALKIFEILSAVSSMGLQTNQQENSLKQIHGENFLDDLKSIAGKIDRTLTFRDTIKWADRMSKFHRKSFVGIAELSDYRSLDISRIPHPARDGAFIELADCVCLSIPLPVIRQKVLKVIAICLSLPESVVENYLRLYKPSISYKDDALQIGRATIHVNFPGKKGTGLSTSFAQTGTAMRLMERLSVSIINNEPILLVGETGVGKTTVIQEIAKISGRRFSVINLSQQTDSSDLVGGFRPRLPGDEIIEIVPEFIDLVKDTWKRGDNEEFLSRVLHLAKKKKWSQLLRAYKAAIGKWTGALGNEDPEDKVRMGTKRRRQEHQDEILERWQAFSGRVDSLIKSFSVMERGFAFSFSEGILVKAFQQGWWLLLDEINLAPTEVLERVAGILDSRQGWILTERGDEREIKRHPDFRIFAAMNPATDSGKKSLPTLIRDRFTEFWVDEPSDLEDLITIASQHLGSMAYQAPVENIVRLYITLKEKSASLFQDGSGTRPIYNLRTLTRSLEYARKMTETYGPRRSLIDGFAMSFQTQLDGSSCTEFDRLIALHLLPDGVTLKKAMKASPQCPSPSHVRFDDFWVEGGEQEPLTEEKFIITPTVMGYLRNLARAVLLKKYPILLQGPTSSGKTSLISYLAGVTGHRCIRINNHEHTDIQDYIGSYMSDSHGRLVFNEGPLIQALRNGYWIILDELNLAPSEVLEALNRLLDDNRELFVPELQEVVIPHRHFMLFATQNPPGIYAGRKTLSRAFRSRFLEIHVDDIPDNELQEIIEKKCSIAPSYSRRIISVMRDLQRRRSASNIFAGKHGYITPRDLFRWANRPALSYEDLAINGYFVLAERLRDEDDKGVVLDTLEKVLKAKIPRACLYDKIDSTISIEDRKIVWTPSFQRIFCLIQQCLQNNEPALLVGETGIGKTTACQLLAECRNQRLHILNCNHHTETSDFIGGFRPNRRKGAICKRLREESANMSFASITRNSDFIDALFKHLVDESSSISAEVRESWLLEIAAYRSPFEWIDGPLVQAMRNGDIILIDEINLAQDAVLERLNSVLESSKILTLAEKSGPTIETIVAHQNFQIVATMNPGGDFGKKELSPALMNRFTSFWVPALKNRDEILAILNNRLEGQLHDLSDIIVDFWAYFELNIATAARQNLSVRDMLCMVDFINLMCSSGLEKIKCLIHSIEMVVIDGIGLGSGVDEDLTRDLQSSLKIALNSILERQGHSIPEMKVSSLERAKDRWGVYPFFIQSTGRLQSGSYNFDTETARRNLYIVLRAMQLNRPILLEGSPGVGKTTLVEAMCQSVGQRFLRINLSDQTDMMDLLGANLPSPDGSMGEFVWADGPLLQAMKSGAWVLLDELNLANQSILEGLNALLDHRGEIYVPELDSVVSCKPGFRIFGAQNPIHEGGGRKGLPRSFLNRFIRVHIRGFSSVDLINISESLYPRIPKCVVQTLTDFVVQCSSKTSYDKQQGVDFNLRDLLRWCSLVDKQLENNSASDVENVALRWSRFYGGMLFSNRMRSIEDYTWMEDILDTSVSDISSCTPDSSFKLDGESITIGNASLSRCKWGEQLNDPPQSIQQHGLLRSVFHVQETVIECAKNQWLGILVGAAGSGKSSCISDIASMLGKNLVQIQIHEGTDIADLLGGFEQIDLAREGANLVSRFKKLLKHLSILFIHHDESASKLKTLCQILFEDKDTLELDSLRYTVQGILANAVPIGGLIQQCGNPHLDKELSMIQKHAGNFLERSVVAGKFEWVDGTLTKCIIGGSWVILRDANLCNPSVLDRLNPLFEPGGLISLNECGSTEDGPRIIEPHPDFRLFITYDPIYGEISRAMRNRGIEVNVLWNNTRMDCTTVSTTESDLSGFMGSHFIPKCISDRLIKLWQSDFIPASRKTLQYLSNWSTITHNLICQGMQVTEALSLSFEQIFNSKIPSQVLDFQEQFVEFDSSIFTHPRVMDICQSSGVESILSDWGFLIQTCHASFLYDQLHYEKILSEYGAFAGFLYPILRCHNSGSMWSFENWEDSVNAAMAIFIGDQEFCKRAQFLLKMICQIDSKAFDGSACQELTVWKTLLSDLLKNGNADLNPGHVRVLLERYRLKISIHFLPDKFEQCQTLLEATAWCFERPFSQEYTANDAVVMKWIWVACTSLYDMDLNFSMQEVYDNLSFARRILMSQTPHYDREVLAHTWQRLMRCLDGHVIPDWIEKPVQKVSSFLFGEEEQIDLFIRFSEIIGQPMVPLSFEFHKILIKAKKIANQASISQDQFLIFREDQGSKELSDIVLRAIQPSSRYELMKTLQIFLAGSLLDIKSASQLREMLPQVSDFLERMLTQSKENLTHNGRLLNFGTSFEQQDALDDIILRQMEVDLVARNAWQYLSRGILEQEEVSMKVDQILKQSASVSSRMISETLPFQAFSGYSKALGEEADVFTKTRAQKGISSMVLLQMHKNIWLPYLFSDNKYAERGILPLHTCAVSAAVAKIACMDTKASLKHKESRLHQIETCIRSIIQSRDIPDEVEMLEWRSAAILLTMEVICISGEHPELSALGSLNPVDSLNFMRSHMDQVFHMLASLQGQGVDTEIIDALKQSFQLLVLDECTMLRNDTLERGRTISLLSLVQLHFSKPRTCFDPSLAGRMEREALETIKNDLYGIEMETRATYSNLPLSRPQAAEIENIRSQMNLFEQKKSEITETTSARPEVSQYSSMKEDIDVFMSHLGNTSRITKIIQSFEGLSSRESFCKEAILWVENTSSFIDRMNDKYPCYKDIFGPVELGLRGIQYGLSLMVVSTSLEGHRSGKACAVQRLLTTKFSDDLIEAEEIDKEVWDRNIEGKNNEESLSHKLRLCQITLGGLEERIRHASSPEQKGYLYLAFEKIGRYFHYVWEIMREKENDRLEEEQASFEIKARSLQISKEELLTKIEIDSLFDNQYSLYYDIQEEKSMDTEGYVENQQAFHRDREKLNVDPILSRLVNVFYWLNDSDEVKEVKRQGDDPFWMGIDIMQSSGTLFPRIFDLHSVPGFLLSLSEEHARLRGLAESKSSDSVHSSNVQEASRLLIPLETLLAKVNNLLQEWPENPILEQLAGTGNKILELSLGTPLKAFLTGVELILNRAQIWEETAAKHVTLAESLKPLISIAVSWRKLELNGWKGLLTKVKNDEKKRAYMSWFHIFGIVNTKMESITEFVNAMDSFVQDSSVGQFHERLKVLRTFASYLVKAPRPDHLKHQDTIVSNVLFNLDRYYLQFGDNVSVQVDREMAPLEKKLSDFVALARWEDKGFYAMKASSEKSHNQLYKIMKKAREVLENSCSHCLLDSTQIIGDKIVDQIGSKTKLLLDSLPDQLIAMNLSFEQVMDIALGKYSAKLEKVSKKFENLVRFKSEALDKVDYVASSLDILACSIFIQVSELKRDIQKGAKMRKKKAFTDLLKAFEKHGISNLQSSIPATSRYNHYWITQPTPRPDSCFSQLERKIDNAAIWDTGDLYYFKSIARLRKLDQICQRPHQDIQQREVQVANNLVRHSLFTLQKARKTIFTLSNLFNDLGKSIYAIRSARQTCGTGENVPYNRLQEALSSCILVNAKYMNYFDAISNNVSTSVPLEKIKALSKFIDESQRIVSSLKNRLVDEREKAIEFDESEYLVTREMEKIFTECRDSMSMLSNSIVQHCSPDIPGAEFLKASYQELSAVVGLDQKGIQKKAIDVELSSEIASTYEDLVTSCMIWAQNTPSNYCKSDDESISLILPEVERVLNLPNIHTIAERSCHLVYLVDKLRSSDSVYSNDARAMLSNILPFLQATQKSLECFLLHLCVLHRSLAKLSYVSLGIFCDLFENGFCVQEEQTQEGEEEDVKDGTGLGEGETSGAKDISDQLHDQDQILGAEIETQDDNEKEENFGDDDNKAQGIEMDDDFEGLMDDVEEVENEEGENEGEDDEDQQLDQQMGDTDGADIVDEKVWDNEDEEASDHEVEDKSKSKANASSLDYAKGGLDESNEQTDTDDGENKADDADENLQDLDDKSDDREDLNRNVDEEEGDAMNEEVDLDSIHPEAPKHEDENEERDAVDENPEPDDIHPDDTMHENDDEGGINEDYEENIDTGFNDHENSCEDLELPEDMNLDDMDLDLENLPEEEENRIEEADNDVIDDQHCKANVNEENEMATSEVSEGGMGEEGAKNEHESNNIEDLNDHKSAGPNDPNVEALASHPDSERNKEDKSDTKDGTGENPVDRVGENDGNREQVEPDTNPFRSVQSAVEHWKKQNAIDLEDLEENDDPELGRQSEHGEQEELRFVREDEIERDGDDNVLADANDEQAQHGVQNEDEAEEQQNKLDNEDMKGNIEEEQGLMDPSSKNDPLEETRKDNTNSDSPKPLGKDQESTRLDIDAERDMVTGTLAFGGLSLSEQKQDSLRAHIDDKIHLINSSEILDIDYGREVWRNCELLTAHLSSELAEQIRLILEPTTASKLGGEYRSGKRINMKRVIGYIASHFKKDKIWMRRTQPDKRRYQVLVAIDDSRSMAETACGAFALESLTLICNAMSKIEIGDLGVVRFGASIGAELVHPLGQSFSPGDGAKVMSKMRFDADNTINDRPMVDLLEAIDSTLDQQGKKLSHSASLQQLVIILADGRFHEKDDLKKVAMDVTSRPGVMYAYIILDSPKNSILDMQSVSFGSDGKPLFNKYIDSFPFPLYTVVQDIHHLPRALAHLVRQWIEYTSHSM